MASIGVFGAAGRMGKAIAAELEARGIAAGPMLDEGYDASALTPGAAGAMVDFSVRGALRGNLAAAVAAGIPLVIGTTGLDADDHAAIDAAAATIAVLQTGNTSLGVNMIAALVEDAAHRLGPDWDIEIVEMHHRHKVDAPSGTALLLGEAAARGRGIDLASHNVSGRDGITGARESGSIGFAALRGGSVPGDHRVLFATEGEIIEIAHRAETRAIFARGAVTAALWLIGRAPGRYAMRDVLGI